MNTTQFDGIIVGGGLVGAALAVALAEQGKQLALLELQPPTFDLSVDDDDWDARIYAISPGNEAFLRRLNAWPDAKRIQTVTTMDVRGDAGGKIKFQAHDLPCPHLTSIVENRWLLQTLWQRLRSFDSIHVHTLAASAMCCNDKQANVTLSNGQVLTASAIFAADGAHSWVRRQTNIAVHAHAYQHHAIVCNYATTQAHGQTARQWFQQGDVLAYLPLPGQRLSIVWSTHQHTALMALSDAEFAQRVAAQGEYSLGELTPLGSRFAFELILKRPERMYAQRLALLGDAAHTIHPLAGQGVNLGFGDVMVLAQLLQHADDLGRSLVLREYQARRLHAVRSMQLGCDGLFQLFQHPAAATSWLRNTGLNLVNQFSGLKNQLIRQAMGL